MRPDCGATYLQTCLRYAQEWQGARGGDFGSDFGLVEGVAGSCEGSEPGRVCFPERGADHSSIGGQSLAANHAAEVEKIWIGLGNVPGLAKDQRQFVEEVW